MSPGRLAAAIVCLPRSGSHMLAACLASHPMIGSYGEFVGRTRAVPFPTEPVAIGIVMYSQWEQALAAGVEIDRVIHLQRDPRRGAISALRNWKSREVHGAQHRAHAHRTDPPLPPIPAIDPDRIAPLAAERARAQVAFRERLRGLDPLDVSYEALTGDRSIDALPEAESRRLLAWLGLPYLAPLRTGLVKTGPIPVD